MLDVLDYAHAAGVSGNGPAIAAICTEDNAGEVISIWSNYGEVLKARLSNESAKVSVHEVS
jgi:shikimate kinase